MVIFLWATTITGSLASVTVTGTASFNGNVNIGAQSTDTYIITDDTTAKDAFSVHGATTPNGAVNVGDASADAASVTGNMVVTKTAQF